MRPVRTPRIPSVRRSKPRLVITFRDAALCETALTHKSWLNEAGDVGRTDNERLEFLGDAVLALVVSDLLMRRFPDHAPRASCRGSAPRWSARAGWRAAARRSTSGSGSSSAGARSRRAGAARVDPRRRAGGADGRRVPRRRLRRRRTRSPSGCSPGASTTSSSAARARLQVAAAGAGRRRCCRRRRLHGRRPGGPGPRQELRGGDLARAARSTGGPGQSQEGGGAGRGRPQALAALDAARPCRRAETAPRHDSASMRAE